MTRIRLRSVQNERQNALRAAREIPLTDLYLVEKFEGFDIFFNDFAQKYVVEIGEKRHQITRILNIRNKILEYNEKQSNKK